MTERGISLHALTVALGAFSLNHLDLAVRGGERLVIIGPNGAGKSVTLETIAGFHRPRTGRIVIRGREVTGLPPERRNVAFMLQNFGLFPHLTVAGNIALGLHRVRRDNRRQRIAQLLKQFGIAHLAARFPQGLSPGEKQRTGLARALAAEPDVFLFDEPFSALDAGTHDRLRQELLDFLERTGIPAIVVTHDRSDAHALGTALAVLQSGTIVQHGPVREVFHTPNSRFVAGLLGVENVVTARLTGRSCDLATVDAAGVVLQAAVQGAIADPAQRILIAIRAEDIDIIPPGEADRPAANRLSARVLYAADEGVLTKIRLDCGIMLQVRAMSRTVRGMQLAPGSVVDIAIAPEAIRLMPTEPDPATEPARAVEPVAGFQLQATPGIVRP